MRLAADEVRRARLRRGSLVGLTCASVAALVLSVFLPKLEPWLGSPRASLLLLASAAAGAALVAFLGGRKGSSWSNADDVAWVVALGVLSVLAGASSAPVGIGMLLQCVALMMLAARNPSGTLVVIASATTAFVPIVHVLLFPLEGSVLPAVMVSTIATTAFTAMTHQTRNLVRVLAEREALLSAQATKSSSASASGSTASSRSSRTTAAAEEVRVASPAHEGATDHGWDALVERVRSSITVMAQTAGIAARVQAELDGLAPPSNKMRTNLLRIAQEATTQAIRHAGPSSILVTLRRADGGVVFELQDDGESGDGTRQKRSLATLRGRVAALGGTAEVRRSESGWVTRVRLPCEQLN